MKLSVVVGNPRPGSRTLKVATQLARRLAEESGETRWYEIAHATEQEMLARKRLNANVDYYAALVLYHLGFPMKMFTSFITSSRIAGWSAHILEQYANNRLIRPRTLYRGPVGVRRES